MSEYLPNLPRHVRQRVDGQWEGADHPDGPWRIASPDGIRWAPWPTDQMAVPESREPASVAPEATGSRPLSPAAQAVLDAVHEIMTDTSIAEMLAIAAALRAVADHQQRQEQQQRRLEIPFNKVEEWEQITGTCAKFYAAAQWGYAQALNEQRFLAAELEGADG